MIEERSFARLDHASVAMGLVILPLYACGDVFRDSSKPQALDIEMKFLQNEEFVIK